MAQRIGVGIIGVTPAENPASAGWAAPRTARANRSGATKRNMAGLALSIIRQITCEVRATLKPGKCT